MKKRLFSLLLICMLAVSLLPTAAFAVEEPNYEMNPQDLPLTLNADGTKVEGTNLTYDPSLTEYDISHALKVDMSLIQTMYTGLKVFIDTPTMTFSDYVTFEGGFKLTLTVDKNMEIGTAYQSAADLKTMTETAFSTSTGSFSDLFTVGDASWSESESGKTATFTISFKPGITGKSITAAGGIPASITFTAPEDMLAYPQAAYPAYPESGTLTAKAALTESNFTIGIPKDPLGQGSDYQTSLMNKVNGALNNPFTAPIAQSLFPQAAEKPITGLNVSVKGSATNELTMAMPKPLSKVASPTVLPPDTLKTTITLTLPSMEKKKDADIVFVVDASDENKIDNIVSEAQAMVDELLNKNNVNAKVGIVQFSEQVKDVRSLTELTAESAVDVNADLTAVAKMVADEMAANPNMSRGSNIQGALRNAKDMLTEDDAVAATNKYIVLLTDGGPTFYENKDRDVMTMYVNPGGRVAQYDTRIGHQERYSTDEVANYNAASVQALLTESILADGTDLKNFPEIEKKLKNVGPDFGDNVAGKDISDVPGAQPLWSTAPVYVTMLEKGFYHLCTEMLEITEKDYNIITVSWPYHKEKFGGEVHTKMAEGLMLWIEQYIGPRYINDSATASEELSSLDNTLYRQLGSGTVTDVITDKFDLVIEDGVCPFTLTVGGVAQTAVADGENKWNFGVANNEGVYPYSVSYTPGNDEQFVWTVNVPTENDVPVDLSYDLLLNDTSESGTFPTNKSATLSYKDSDGIQQTDKLFEVPEVEYTSDKPEFRTDHVAYIIGREDGLVHPEANITRGETATIFFRLLTDASRNSYWKTTNNFSDVTSDIWFNNAVSTMANANFVNGYPDGTFSGNNFITRAEFATIAARANGADGVYAGTDKFTDISGHWAQGYINDAVDLGLVEGYPGGTFRPDAYITRAEAMTLVNRFLNRDKVDSTSLISGMIEWPDNMRTGAWYYYAVQEATNSHEYTLQSNGYETWTKIVAVPDWEALEKSWSTANSGK